MGKLTDIGPKEEKNGYQTNKRSLMHNISFQGSKIEKEHKMSH